MTKIAQRYLEVDPWKLIEKGFHEDRAEVSESLFSLSNEYLGVRGFFDEGYPKKSLVGTYFNGIYEVPKEIKKSQYKGISDKNHYMANACNFFYTRIYFNDELFVFDPDDIKDYERVLDFKTGVSVRSYRIKDYVKVSFKRILDMRRHQIAHQVITVTPLNYRGKIRLDIGLDFDVKHWGAPGRWEVSAHGDNYILGRTTTNQQVFVKYRFSGNLDFQSEAVYRDRLAVNAITFELKDEFRLEKNIAALINKRGDGEACEFVRKADDLLAGASFNETLRSNTDFYRDYWSKNDIIIVGDEYNQQGIRFCLFQLVNTYHGFSDTNNIGAKGLTGEAYSGHAFWDSETFCLPVYLFSNPPAAKNLLMFRYNTLPEARLRAKELDCRGAAYPIATLNGTEACDLWQHASLQLQPTSGVAYAIWHYVKVTNDYDFLFDYGLEMLIEIARFFSSRGQYNHDRTKFGYYGVMGPDEFQMMVNHNAYTNLLAKYVMEYLIEILDRFKDESRVGMAIKKLRFTDEEKSVMIEQAEKMFIPYDPKTKIYEQHLGFHDLPHIDINEIPVTDFPLYSHWTYDRIYRNDMIKQPDVLMFMFLYNQKFDLETKKANFDYYEPKTIHESSLSPSIHSILAAEIGYHQKALDYFGFATRMDIDDYNRNTNEGLHMTSIAAAWLNIVYGFGGLRSDGEFLKIAPACPEGWRSYQFRIQYLGTAIHVSVTPTEVIFTCDADLSAPIIVYDKKYMLKKGMTKVSHVGN